MHFYFYQNLSKTEEHSVRSTAKVTQSIFPEGQDFKKTEKDPNIFCICLILPRQKKKYNRQLMSEHIVD